MIENILVSKKRALKYLGLKRPLVTIVIIIIIIVVLTRN